MQAWMVCINWSDCLYWITYVSDNFIQKLLRLHYIFRRLYDGDGHGFHYTTFLYQTFTFIFCRKNMCFITTTVTSFLDNRISGYYVTSFHITCLMMEIYTKSISNQTNSLDWTVLIDNSKIEKAWYYLFTFYQQTAFVTYIL